MPAFDLKRFKTSTLASWLPAFYRDEAAIRKVKFPFTIEQVIEELGKRGLSVGQRQMVMMARMRIEADRAEKIR